MFIAQILHIPGAEQCRCPEKFIEIFGFSESRRNFGHFGFDTRTVGQAAGAGVVCIPQVWGDARFAEITHVRILHAPARLFELRLLLLLACRLLACRECLASFLFKSLPAVPSVCLGSPGSLSTSSSGSRSIKLGKSEKLNGSIGPEFIGPSFAVDSADWSHCRIQKLLLYNDSRQHGPLKVTKLEKARKK